MTRQWLCISRFRTKEAEIRKGSCGDFYYVFYFFKEREGEKREIKMKRAWEDFCKDL